MCVHAGSVFGEQGNLFRSYSVESLYNLNCCDNVLVSGTTFELVFGFSGVILDLNLRVDLRGKIFKNRKNHTKYAKI